MLQGFAASTASFPSCRFSVKRSPGSPLTRAVGAKHHGVPTAVLVADERASVCGLELSEARLRDNFADVRFAMTPDPATPHGARIVLRQLGNGEESG